MNPPLALLTIDYPPQQGGIARYLSSLVRAAQGQIDVFVPQTQPVAEGSEPVERLPFAADARWFELVPVCFALGKRGYQTLLLSHVVPLGTAAMIASFFGGPAYVVLLHGLDFRLAQRSWLKRCVLHLILRRAQHVLTNSQAVAAEIKQFENKIQPVVLTPGCEPLMLPSRRAARVQLGISPGTLIYLTVTRLIPRKGIDTFLFVLAKLPANARYVIVGAGQDEQRLRRLVEQLKLTERVRFVLNPDDTTRNQWYAAADQFVFLARDEGKDVEGFGMVCLEAAAAGLPVLAGNSGGVPETIVDGVTGALVDPQDIAHIVRICQHWAHNPEIRTKFGEAGKERVLRDFRWSDRWTQLARLLGYLA